MVLLTASHERTSIAKHSLRRSHIAIVTILGLASIILISWFFLHQANEKPIESPRLELADDADISEETKELSKLLLGGTIKRYDLKMDGIRAAITSFEALEMEGKPPLVVNWKSHVNQPIFRSDIYAKEELQLFAALEKYLPKTATVLAFPELSNRIQNIMDDVNVPLAGVTPIISTQMPDGWLDSAILPYAQPKALENETSNEQWMNFREALVSEDIYGAAQMRALSANEDTYIILHLRDIFDLGAELGDRLLVAMKDFQGDAHAHDLTRLIKDWQAVNNYASYAAVKIPDGRLRVYFLSDAKDKSTIIGQLLPFDGARVGLAPGTKLVFQAGGYWVYKLLPV